MGRWVRTAAFVVGAATLTLATAGALAPVATAGFLGSIGITGTVASVTVASVTAIAGAASGALSLAAGMTTPGGTLGGNPTSFKIDKESGIPVVLGRTFRTGALILRGAAP